MTNPFQGKTVTLEDLWRVWRAQQETTREAIVRALGVDPLDPHYYLDPEIKNPPPADQAEDGEKEP